VCGVFGTQVVPGTDKVAVPMIGAFQREVYDRMNRKDGQAERTTENGVTDERGEQLLFQLDIETVLFHDPNLFVLFRRCSIREGRIQTWASHLFSDRWCIRLGIESMGELIRG